MDMRSLSFGSAHDLGNLVAGPLVLSHLFNEIQCRNDTHNSCYSRSAPVMIVVLVRMRTDKILRSTRRGG